MVMDIKDSVAKAMLNAARKRYRFSTARHQTQLQFEDLFDLPLQSATKQSLDAIAIELNEAAEAKNVVSFVNTGAVNPKANEAKEKLELVLLVIQIRQEENARRSERARSKEMLAIIDAEIERRKHSSMVEKPSDELVAERERLLALAAE